MREELGCCEGGAELLWGRVLVVVGGMVVLREGLGSRRSEAGLFGGEVGFLWVRG